MRYYELTYLLAPNLSEEELTKITEKINSFISEQSGILGKPARPERKRLGYEINKNKEAFLASISFSLNPKNLKQLRKSLDAESGVIRYSLVQKETPEKKTKRMKKTKKVDLKEIDKKIDQILE